MVITVMPDSQCSISQFSKTKKTKEKIKIATTKRKQIANHRKD